MPQQQVVSVMAPSACSSYTMQTSAQAHGIGLARQQLPVAQAASSNHKHAVGTMLPAVAPSRQTSTPGQHVVAPSVQTQKFEMQSQKMENAGAAAKDTTLINADAKVQERAQPRPRSHRTTVAEP